MKFQLPQYREPDFDREELIQAPDVVWVEAERDFIVPENYHATSIFPEYYKVNGQWILAEEARMDCVAVLEGDVISVKEFRNIRKGDLVAIGRTENGEDGILVHPDCFVVDQSENEDTFAFRQRRSRETGFSTDYKFLYEYLKHERDYGNIVWVMGPACTFDDSARRAFTKLADAGYVDAVLAGNALATHDLEAAWKNTALGQDIKNQKLAHNGHYNHIDTLNKVRGYGSMEKFIQEEKIDNGIVYSCLKNNIPMVLTGSIRDDGPMPEVYADVYRGQDAMRQCVKKATTVICMASMLHTIATGNMTPTFRVLEDGTIRPVYFYSVDISEFAVNKLGDRGSLSAKSIVTNVQDFLIKIKKGLNLD
ncbi:MAG: hypothetical protein IJ486_11240 [Firmicutes bacterium]|nr:hypothetical protein [Bacillota bacterium]